MTNIIREALDRRAPLWPISLSRVLIGLLWLVSLRWKLPPDFAPATGKGLMDWLQLEVEHAAFGFYGNFVESIVIPNFTLFAWLVFLLELLIGLMLVTGTWTRLGATLGLLMAVNLGIGLLEVPGEWPWSYIMLAMWHAVFVITAAGRVLGIDAWLRQRLPATSPWLLFT
ncbi:MAG TPA: DoxX family membrane protein [Anaerolineae bacterium]|nr:DoxX family membrane protein [Anaerolineae bacterium]